MKAVRSGYTADVDLLTFGHGTASQEELAGLITGSGMERVVDVRTVPKSRLHPHVWSDRMAEWVPRDAGAEYIWERELGGFRKVKTDSRNIALRNESFRGYADYMETAEFQAALAKLVSSLNENRTAVMCSESVWWRCHRRLIADAATLLHGVNVLHVMPGGNIQPHALTKGVRREGDLLIYDGVVE